MERDRFLVIIQALNKVPISACPHFIALSARFGVPVNTLHSIHSQEVQTRVRLSGNDLKSKLNELIKHYLAGVDLLEMCFDLNLPPCHVLRQVLIALNLGLTQNKRTITEVMKDPPSLLSLVSIEVAQETLQQRNSIPEGTDAATAAQAFLSRLIKDVTLCVDCDTNYGPSSDAARHFCRRRTPDARLRVPIAVNGRIICWIDSKATFGDEGQHASYRELQYEKYSNRYGPGMVIYWHGYLADLQKLEENVLLVDKFPQSGEIATLPQLPLDATEGGGGGGKARGRLNFREDNGIEP
ncbi:hypothetical protein Ndes2526B_g01736 [Nannochloris sp. 'desiccata']